MLNGAIRVLDLRDSPWVDGPGRTILQCADMMDPELCNIIIGGFVNNTKVDDKYIQKAKELSLDVVQVLEKSTFDLNVLKQINSTIKEKSIDIVHTHDFRSNLYGLISAKKNKIPIVTTCHGWISNNIKGALYTIIDKQLIKYHDLIITVSEVMKEKLVSTGIDPEKISVINNALIVENYIIDKSNSKFRDEFNIPRNKTVIANIGRLSPEKGQEIFIEVAGEISKAYDDAVFLIIGIGPDKDKLVNLVNELGITDKVIFTGYRDDMINIYNNVDVVVQSSKTEGMPNVILESLAMEVPVIATNVGGTGQIIKHQKNGYLLDSCDFDALFTGLNVYFKNKHFFNEMAISGREYIIQNFNHTKRVKQLYDVYKSVT